MANIIQLFIDQPWLFLCFILMLGLIVGSFLNVLILRLPQRMQQELQIACKELNGLEAQAPSNKWFGLEYLITPPSSCPHCGHKISAWENIPLVSYFFLKAKCSQCETHISSRYPIIEAITGIFSLVVAIQFGPSIETTLVLILTWGLIAMSVIDTEHQLLPDVLTIPLLWLGLIANQFELFASPSDALLGAIAGYLSLWLVFHVFYLLTGKEGIGYGDFKLFALFGAWSGWQLLPQILLLSSLVGALIGVGMILLRGRDRSLPIPFGPYIATAGWIALIWGQDINQAYLQFAGLN